MAKRVILSVLLIFSLTQITFASYSPLSTPLVQDPTNKLEPDDFANQPLEISEELKIEKKNSQLASSTVPSSNSILQSLLVTDPKKLSLIEKAYLDAYTILNDDNACSRLYGGPPAIAALNQLVQKLHPTYLNRNIAIRMKGSTTIYQSYLNKFLFRVFDEVELNLDGAFYRSNGLSERRVPLVGKYQPNTRESRVVVLLHELGHMVRGKDKTWLFVDDGDDNLRSQKNSELLIDTCREQIEAIGKLSPAQQLARTQSPRETIAARSESDSTSQF